MDINELTWLRRVVDTCGTPDALQAANAPIKAKRIRIALVCQECGKVWRVSPNAADPQCPKCNSVDFEVRS